MAKASRACNLVSGSCRCMAMRTTEQWWSDDICGTRDAPDSDFRSASDCCRSATSSSVASTTETSAANVDSDLISVVVDSD